MPELPEVEVTRQGIAGPLHGARVLGVRLGKPLRHPLGCSPDALAGTTIDGVQRRGKYLWLQFAAGAGGLLLHLGMSGSLALLERPGAPGPYDHFDLVTSRGTLRLTDPRRFGAVLWSCAIDRDPAARLLARLGAEPFDPSLDAARFHQALRARKAAIKAVLMGGGVIVGAGNIYACEALFEARVDPRTRCDRISRPRAGALLDALRSVLRSAVRAGGTTLRDYRNARGAQGGFQFVAKVYGREAQPCLRCGGRVRRVTQAQRSTFFCPGCQRR
jgi:formamidopyrimidine-DNA glycosylase